MYYNQYGDRYENDFIEEPLKQLGDNSRVGADQLTEDIAEVFRALGDPTRLKILYLIALNDPDAITGARISKVLNISPPTVTHHMNKLEDAGFITRVRIGRRSRYEVCPDVFSNFNVLVRQLSQVLDY